VKKDPAQGEEERPIDLRDPALAAFLAWLMPGLGHYYQGRKAKAILFFVCIMGTFVYGLYLGGSGELGWGRVVYASWRTGDRRLPYLCQVGIGLPALPALVQANRVRNRKPPLFGGFMAPPRMNFGNVDEPTLDMLYDKLPRYFELGTFYTMVAGLLNILAVYDAWGGPVFPEKGKEEGEEQDADDKASADAKS
jgi:hypothetical protein